MVPLSVRNEPAPSTQPWTDPCVSPDGRHDPKVTGYLKGPRPSGVDCEKPLHVWCRRCAAETVYHCQNHRESRCAPCASRYRRRLQRVADYGIRRREGQGSMGMLTLTAPSAKRHRQWSVTNSRKRADCACGDALADGLGRWNATCAASWNHARTALVRAYPGLVFLRAVEVQKRGALHLHVIVWTPDPLDLAEVQRLVLLAGFGCVLDWAPCEPGSRRAAYYVAKYVTKATDQRDDCPWEVEEASPWTGELRTHSVPARYRTWSASQAWGLTMREVRAVISRAAAQRATVDRDRGPGERPGEPRQRREDTAPGTAPPDSPD